MNLLNGKRGNEAFNRLIKIIILVVVLLFLSFLVMNGIVPGIEEVGGKANEVLNMLMSLGNSGGFYEGCIDYRVSDFILGSEMLKKLGIKDDDIGFKQCRDRTCTFEGGGLDDYEMMKGKFRKLTNGEWVEYNNLIVGSEDSALFDWEVYHVGIGILQSVDVRDLMDEGSTMQFSLIGDGSGGDANVELRWQNGIWEFWKNGKFVREIDNDDEALTLFYDEVKDIFNDDKVNWRLSENKVGVEYLKGEGKGLDSLLFGEKVEDKKVKSEYLKTETLYDAVMAAEHRGYYDYKSGQLKDGYDPWIRTKIDGSSSTAYGPLQLTKSLAQGYLKKEGMNWDDREKRYLERFVEQGNTFLKWGGEDMPRDKKDPKTGEDVSRYDYGGSGDLNSDKDKMMYKIVVEKMLAEIYGRHKGDVDNVWREWRFGINKMSQEDAGYEVAFYKVLENENFVSAENYGDSGELDSEADLARLKDIFAGLRTRLLVSSSVSGSDIEALKKSFAGEKVVLKGEEFVVGVEQSEGKAVLSFSKGESKFGLKQSGAGKTVSDFEFWVNDAFRRVDLEYYPVLLVTWNGSSWIESGDEGTYRLGKYFFDEVYRASVISKFLDRRC